MRSDGLGDDCSHRDGLGWKGGLSVEIEFLISMGLLLWLVRLVWVQMSSCDQHGTVVV